MTQATKPVTRETAAQVRGRSVVVTVSARSIGLRLKGTRIDQYEIGIGDLFELLEWRAARAAAAAKAAESRRVRRLR